MPPPIWETEDQDRVIAGGGFFFIRGLGPHAGLAPLGSTGAWFAAWGKPGRLRKRQDFGQNAAS